LVAVGYETGEPEAMLRLAADAAKRGDSDVEGLVLRAYACHLFGFPDAAIQLVTSAQTLDPSSQHLAWLLPITLVWADRHAQALETGKTYIRRFGEDAEIYFWMGIAAGSLGHRPEASLYLGR